MRKKLNILIAVGVVGFIAAAVYTLKAPDHLESRATVEIIREKEPKLEIGELVEERLLLEVLKGRRVLELMEENRIKKEEIYIYYDGSGEVFGIISEDGKVKYLQRLDRGIIQPVAGGDATR